MDDNLAVYCKYAGELSFLAQAYPSAAAFLTLARDHFKVRLSCEVDPA